MKSYISIPKEIRYDQSVLIVNKFDGSQIRSEWSRKQSFYKFGTKNQMLGEDNQIFGPAIQLVKEIYQEDLSKIFTDKKLDHVTCFFEFFGPNSFAGWHDPNDKKEVILFDINLFKQGLISAKDFYKLVGHLKVPDILYEGKFNKIIEEQIRDSSFPGITFEGVICKGPIDRKTKLPIMFKVKTRAWLDKLKNKCADNEKLFEELS
jgi:hypothetical protein